MDTSRAGKRNRYDADDDDQFPKQRHGRRGRHESGPDEYDRGWALRQYDSRGLAKLSYEEYTVGWVFALHIEIAAAKGILDEVHESLPTGLSDSNTYILGGVGKHNVVIACLPIDGYGIAHAANVATNMNQSFPSIRVRLMVGVGGGVPGKVDVDILNKEFKRGRIFAVKRRLQEMPTQLSELFKDILTRDAENMADLLLCIQWILYAKRPLKPEELYFAVVSGLDPNPKNLAKWNPGHITTDDIGRFVLSSSKGLAEISKCGHQTVRFIRESVRDFLIKDDGLRDLWTGRGEDFESLSHDRLKKCCQAYLQIDICDCVTPGEALPEATVLRPLVSSIYPFLEYTIHHVLYHAHAAANGVPQDDFLKEFPLEAWVGLHNLFAESGLEYDAASISLLYILAEGNTPRLIKTMRYHDPRINIRGGRYRYPLFAAFASGRQDAVRALLQQETNTPLGDDIVPTLKHRWEFGPHSVRHRFPGHLRKGM